jgi:hypothetical protein
MMIGVFVLFNGGIYLAAVGPSVLYTSVPYPQAPIPFSYFLNQNLKFFVDCLPILSLQYLISLRYKNFLVSVGTGFMIWVLSIGMASWEYSFIFPYIYSSLDHFIASGNMPNRVANGNIQWIAFAYFIMFTVAGYILYANSKEKG